MMPANRKAGLLPLALFVLLSACKGNGPAIPVNGTVRDAKGLPVPGAVISDGSSSTITDDSGGFALLVSSRNLKVHKSRFAPLDFQAKDSNELTLVPRTTPLTVAWDMRWGGGQSEGIRKSLGEKNIKVIPFKDAIPEAEVLVVSCPSAFSEEAAREAREWVGKGGDLILFGEWGGFPSFDQSGVNRFLEGTGIRFSGATVRLYDPHDQQRPEWLQINAFTSRALINNLTSGPLLFTAGSLDLSAPAQILAQTGAESYRIAAYSKGAQIVAACSPLGFGKLVVWSDTSFITDADSQGTGTPDWKSADNAALAFNLLGW